MINYLTVTTRDGQRTLSILNTEAEDHGLQIEHAGTVRNVSEAAGKADRIQVLEVKRSYQESIGASVEALIAQALASRAMWSLYDEKGQIIGSSNGDWKSWYVNSRLVDNGVLARFALAKLEDMRVLA